jgi:hypothetical protein
MLIAHCKQGEITAGRVKSGICLNGTRGVRRRLKDLAAVREGALRVARRALADARQNGGEAMGRTIGQSAGRKDYQKGGKRMTELIDRLIRS